MSDPIYYILRAVEPPPPRPAEFHITTTSILSCSLCGQTIAGMGGPGYGALCRACGDDLIRGRLRGTVKRTEESR